MSALVKRDNEGWTATVILDNSSSAPLLDEYVRKLYDRVFQGRKEWMHVTTKVSLLQLTVIFMNSFVI